MTTPQDFDFDKWLEDADRPAHSVTVYQKAGLVAELEELAERIKNTDDEDVDGPSMGGGVGALRAKYADLHKQFHDSALTIRVQSLTREEKSTIAAEHEDLDETEIGSYTLAQAITSPKMTAEQVRRLARVIGDGQFNRVVQAYWRACDEVPSVSADFLPKRSTPGDGGE